MEVATQHWTDWTVGLSGLTAKCVMGLDCMDCMGILLPL